jgi:hypothetical protein
MVSMRTVLYGLNTEVKVMEASEKDKLTVKQVMAKFRAGKTHAYDILIVQSLINNWLNCSNGSIK